MSDTVDIKIQLPKETFMDLALEAHTAQVTLDKYLTFVIVKRIRAHEKKLEAVEAEKVDAVV